MTIQLEDFKTCIDCGEAKPRDDFYGHKMAADGRQSMCKPCSLSRTRKWRIDNADRLAEYEKRRAPKSPEVRRSEVLRREYGIEQADYDALVEKQGGRCAICGDIPQPGAGRRLALFVDHCHESNKVRGLLCNKCNLAIGHMDDNVDRLRAAIKYLEESGC